VLPASRSLWLLREAGHKLLIPIGRENAWSEVEEEEEGGAEISAAREALVFSSTSTAGPLPAAAAIDKQESKCCVVHPPCAFLCLCCVWGNSSCYGVNVYNRVPIYNLKVRKMHFAHKAQAVRKYMCDYIYICVYYFSPDAMT
jgi:hypothetical protein